MKIRKRMKRHKRRDECDDDGGWLAYMFTSFCDGFLKHFFQKMGEWLALRLLARIDPAYCQIDAQQADECEECGPDPDLIRPNGMGK